MIIAVMDSIFVLTLYPEKRISESYSYMMDILFKVKKMFGTPSVSISNMRFWILEVLKYAFPEMPVRICLMHFLHYLGKYLMNDMHTILGTMINRKA